MTEKPSPPTSTLRNKVSTGYARLDEALQGGFLSGSAIVLSAPASDEVPLLLRNFLESSGGSSLFICGTLSWAENLARAETVKAFVCSDKPPSPSKNIIPGKGVENLTELNLAINDSISQVQPKRLVIEILPDVLLRHKALQTRKWLKEVLERLRSKGITTLVVLNPYMHSMEDTQAVTDLFDGNLEILEKQAEAGLKKVLRVKWMHGVEVTEKEFLLTGLAQEPISSTEQIVVKPSPLKEPRWLTPLVSRTTELNRLTKIFEDALQGKSSAVALQGEAGIGKSRLMQEVAAYANTKGAAVLWGRASQDGNAYGPWIEIARQYIGQAPAEILRRLLGANASELVKLVPDLAVKLGTIPPPRTSGQQDKTQFYEAVTQFFIAISGTAPLLLLFEDAQNLDQPSAELWGYLVRTTSNLHILSVCSTPPEREIIPNSQLEQVLLKFNKERLLETISLRELERDETTTLIKETFGEQTITPEFADLIYQHTGGNPFFIEEVLRSLVEDGTIFRTEKGWDRKPIQEIALPKSVKNALKSRLTKLDAETLNVLTVASVIGSEFDFQVLQETSQLGEDTLLDDTEKALSAGLILEPPHTLNRFKFADDRIRELLLDDLSRIRRAKYHVKIAEAMEKHSAKSLENSAEMIAAHFSEGGDTERTMKYSIMAGDRNRSVHAYEQAVKNYTQALELIEGGKDAEKAVMLEKLGGCYAMAGKFSNSVEAYQEAVGLLEKLQDHAACARISAQLGSGLRTLKGPEEAARYLKDAMKYVQGNPESPEAASLYGRLAWQLAALERYDEANEWSKRALEVGEKSGNYAAVSDGLMIMSFYLADTGHVDEGLPILERSLNVAKQHNLYRETTQALLNLASYVYPRDLARARDYASQWLKLGKQENNLHAQASATVYLAFFDWLRGDWDGASKEFQEAFEVRNRLGFKITAVNAEAERAQFHLSLGELEKAEDFCQAALARHGEQVYQIVATNLALGKLRLEQGSLEEAKTRFEACVNAFKDYEFTTQPLSYVETLLELTRIYSVEGSVEKARGMVDWAKRLAWTLKSDAGLAMALQSEAAVLVASGDRKGAEESYLECLALWEKAGWPYYQGRALVAYSEAIAQTEPEESKKRLTQAVEIFTKLGAKRDLEKAKAKLSPK